MTTIVIVWEIIFNIYRFHLIVLQYTLTTLKYMEGIHQTNMLNVLLRLPTLYSLG